MKPKGKPYSGKLLQPIVLTDQWKQKRIVDGARTVQLATPAIERADAEARKEQEKERMHLLFDHFQIPRDHPQGYALLAFALARQHVPGFAIARRRGAPVKRDLPLLFALYQWSRRAASSLRHKSGAQPVTRKTVSIEMAKNKAFREAFPALANTSAKSLENMLSNAYRQREANVRHRWERRVALRRWADMPPEDVPVGLFGDTPPWPGQPIASAFRVLPIKD